MIKKSFPIIIIIFILITFAGCTQTDNVIDVRIINNNPIEIKILNIVIDGNELELFNISSNSTHIFEDLDPELYMQGISHNLSFTFKYESSAYNYTESTRFFDYYCYITITNNETSINLA